MNFSLPLLTGSNNSISFGEFFRLMGQSPLIVITVLLGLGVVFVNGWTDAPNSIATAISTRAIPPKKAIIMAAIFNFLGVMIFSLFSVSVAESIAGIVDFGDTVATATTSAEEAVTNAKNALVGMSAGMFGVVVWGILAWAFGVPSSQSHSLVAGLTGACFAMLAMGLKVTPGASSWISVGVGFAASGAIGLVLGYLIAKLIELICKKMVRRKTTIFFKYSQIVAAAGMSFAHGAQDGLKFVGIIYVVCDLAECAYPGAGFTGLTGTISGFYQTPEFLWLPALVSLFMALGTSIGGYRIIKKIGMGMVDLEPFQGFATDISAFIALLISTLCGWPVSTSQVKTFSIMGVGVTKGANKVNWRIALDTLLASVFTFPGCILIGFVMTYILFAIPGIA